MSAAAAAATAGTYSPAAAAGEKRRERKEELRRHLAEDADWPRADGRSFHDCRPAFMQTGPTTAASGSAYAEFGKTKVIVSVFGPRESKKAMLYSDTGRLNCNVSYTTFATPIPGQVTDNKEYSAMLHKALEGTVMLHIFPKTTVDVFALVLESGGSDLPIIISCASLALADAGIMMCDLVTSVSVSCFGKNIIIDPTSDEEAWQDGSITVAYMPARKEITQLTVTGEWSDGKITNAVELCMDACSKLCDVLRERLKDAASLAEQALPPPAPVSHVGLAATLGHHGVIMVLFETPSGFAIFSFDGVRLLLPDAMEDIWANFGRKYRTEFHLFEDKSTAINLDTGVISNELSEMLTKWCCPKLCTRFKLAGISCLFNDAVMEVMWGLKNLMYALVPEEKLQLSREDRLQMSQGLKMLLNRYGFDVKPEMVSDSIIGKACVLYDCDDTEKIVSATLHDGGNILKDVSGIDPQGWSPMKLATALKMVCFPGEKNVVGDPEEMFSNDELSKLEKDAHKYEDKMYNYICLKIYNKLLASGRRRTAKLQQLRSCVKEAEMAHQNEQGDSLRSWGLEPPSKRLRSQ
uniref:Uncharacterized protein n=1 Tax=Oryza punctata TaxID=4537 RepID=A0A0E0LQN4_ORYPU